MDIISFAGSMGPKELIPIQSIRQAADRVLSAGVSARQAGLAEGFLPLRTQLCDRMAAKQMHVHVDQLMITSSTQRALDSLIQVLSEPGDAILVERPTSKSSLQLFALRGLKVIGAASDEFGIIPEDAERLFKEHRPKWLYAIPTVGDPTGRIWSEERRRRLLELCRRHHVFIIEEDPFGDLQWSHHTRVPAMFSLDTEAEKGTVFYISTLTHVLAPALKISWLIGNNTVIHKAVIAKEAAKGYSSLMNQQVLSQLLDEFDLNQHLVHLTNVYEARMLAMDRLLTKQQLVHTTWEKPKGGMFLWLELPDGLDADALRKGALRIGVDLEPGSAFFADHRKRNTARLNFTCYNGLQLKHGIERLAEAIGEFTARG